MVPAVPVAEMLENGIRTTIAKIGAAEKINESYVGRVLRLTLLAPDIVVDLEWTPAGRHHDGHPEAGISGVLACPTRCVRAHNKRSKAGLGSFKAQQKGVEASTGLPVASSALRAYLPSINPGAGLLKGNVNHLGG